MHRLVILPLREHLCGLFVDYYSRSGDIQLLVENVKYAFCRESADFGIRVGPFFKFISFNSKMQIYNNNFCLFRIPYHHQLTVL